MKFPAIYGQAEQIQGCLLYAHLSNRSHSVAHFVTYHCAQCDDKAQEVLNREKQHPKMCSGSSSQPSAPNKMLLHNGTNEEIQFSSHTSATLSRLGTLQLSVRGRLMTLPITCCSPWPRSAQILGRIGCGCTASTY